MANEERDLQKDLRRINSIHAVNNRGLRLGGSNNGYRETQVDAEVVLDADQYEREGLGWLAMAIRFAQGKKNGNGR